MQHSVSSPVTQSDYVPRIIFVSTRQKESQEPSSGSGKSGTSTTAVVSPTRKLAVSSMNQSKLSYRPSLDLPYKY